MPADLEFETPENIRVAYAPAGLGTRYLAWFLDNILLTILMAVMVILTIWLGMVTAATVQRFSDNARGKLESVEFLQYFVGILVLVWGFTSFLYFACSELWMHGQTLGKRMLGLRVVRVDGFSLDASSIFVRNIFRVIDQLPPLWIVLFMSKRAQRFGDMAAGTTVIVDKPQELSEIRKVLADLPAADSRFKFDAMALKRTRPQDIEAIEKILNRWESLPPEQRHSLLEQIVPPLVERMKVEAPAIEERAIFLQDLLAAEYRRQHRNL